MTTKHTPDPHYAEVATAKEEAAYAVCALELVKSDGDFDQLHEVTRAAVDSALSRALASERDTAREEVARLRAEVDVLRAAMTEAASVMESIYESFRDGKQVDPADVDIGIGCWLAKHAHDELPDAGED